jgi:hypothetical protein
MTELLRFNWPLHRDGYEIMNGAGLGRRRASEVLLDKAPGSSVWIIPKGTSSDFREPLKLGKSVFRNFIDWEATPSGALRFSEGFGFLHQYCYEEPQGMLVDEWLRQQSNMRSAITNWETKPDVRKMIFDFNAVNLGPLKTRLSANRPGNGVFVVLEPSSLISMMWVEFALHVSNKSGLRQCEWCGDWFPYGTGTGRRSKARFCSDPCRKAKHAASKKENQSG